MWTVLYVSSITTTKVNVPLLYQAPWQFLLHFLVIRIICAMNIYLKKIFDPNSGEKKMWFSFCPESCSPNIYTRILYVWEFSQSKLWLTWVCRLLPPLSPCYCLPSASPWSPPCPPWNTAVHSGRQQTTPGSSCPAVGHPHPANRFSRVSSLALLWQEAVKRRPSSYPSRPICCKEGKAQTDHSSQVLHKGHLKQIGQNDIEMPSH